MGSGGEPHLPPGYRLDEADPDIVLLFRLDGATVARFSSRGATRQAIERTAWDDYREEDRR